MDGVTGPGWRLVATFALALVFFTLPALATGPAERIARAEAARNRGDYTEAIRLLREALESAPAERRARLLLAETLAWARQFEEAERIYLGLASADPARDVQLGLSRVYLWSGRYENARRLLEQILAADPDDVDAREDLGRAAYWSGDFRSAERHFEETLRIDPARNEARSDLAAIRSAARPVVAAHTLFRSDDQPWEIIQTRVVSSRFSDPLTRWDLLLDARELSGREGSFSLFSFGAGMDVAFRHGWKIAASARMVESEDDSGLMGHLAVSRKVGRQSRVEAGIDRVEILYNEAVLGSLPSVDRGWITWAFDRANGGSARIHAERLEYFDGNQGQGVAGYVLHPVWRNASGRLELGIAAAFRDTDESRFTVRSVTTTPLPGGIYQYHPTGRFDPYWTPHDLREARAIIGWRGEWKGDRIRWTLQASGGVAKDNPVGFAAFQGPTPQPPGNFAFHWDRSFNPWDVTAALEWSLNAIDVRIDFVHGVTVEYEANELRATLVRRF
ncbi:MAG TPA: tetratricopeptide repeat protein [Thermoanaerobaculia bacterium]|nr:tetratricopeptide repeat protein [Thermoanaerobaculia bacterium]